MKETNLLTNCVLNRVLNPGETVEFSRTVQRGDAVSIHLDASCGCGGKMVPHKKKRLVWVCSREHWWKFWNRNHARIVGEAIVMPIPKGNA